MQFVFSTTQVILFLPITGVCSPAGGTTSTINCSKNDNASKFVIENCNFVPLSGGKKNTVTAKSDSKMTGIII